jgi:hypothetical protein
MPIDSRKFKKIITNHFENLTEEDFLKILYKSSPRLFDERSRNVENVQLDNQNEVASENATEQQ